MDRRLPMPDHPSRCSYQHSGDRERDRSRPGRPLGESAQPRRGPVPHSPSLRCAAVTRPDLIVLAPMRIEVLAVRRGARETRIVRTGRGAQASRDAAERAAGIPAARVAIAGVCGGLDPALDPGDLGGANELRGPDGRTLALAGAERLAEALRARGLTAYAGPLLTAEHLTTGAAREAARSGAALA